MQQGADSDRSRSLLGLIEMVSPFEHGTLGVETRTII